MDKEGIPMDMAVTAALQAIIDDIDDDVELARNCADMTDPYYQGQVDALEYVAKEIVERRLNEGETDDEQ
jgi:hypothetical protein